MEDSEEDIDTRGGNNKDIYMDSSEEADEDEYDVDGNYVGVNGTKHKRKRMSKEEQLYGNYWNFNQRDRKKSKGMKSSGGLSFVKKETIVNMNTSETMVKEAIPKKEKPPTPTPAPASSVPKDQSVPSSFGKSGFKKKQEPAAKPAKEEEKYQKYGKGFKMLKMMGFTADQHKEIVHVVKREDGQGLGVKKERHMYFEGKNKREDRENREDIEEEQRIEVERQEIQRKKPTDSDFLQFLMKTSKETKEVKRKKNVEDVSIDKEIINRKSMKIIDETGGAGREMYLRNQEFMEDDYANSMADMKKGFLQSDFRYFNLSSIINFL